MDVIPLNRMLSCKNVTSPELFQETMLAALDDIVNLLLNHCGPASQFSMIIDATNPLKEPIFTKDGIAILSAVHAINPITQLLFKEISYVGQAVDRQVGDGTTSAMIQVAMALKQLLYWDSNALGGQLSNIPYTRLQKCYKQLCEEVYKTTDRFTLTVADVMQKFDISEREAVRYIAFLQAMTSTHGDTELSLAVADVFSKISKSSWKNISYHREVCETENRVQCVIEDDQYQMIARPISPLMLTEDLGTTYLRPIGMLIVSSGPMTSTDVMYAKMTELLETSTTIDITILVPSDIDAHAEHRLMTLCQKYPTHRVGVFYHDSKDTRLNDLAGLSVVAGYRPTFATDQLVVLDNISVEYYNKKLHVNGLYDVATVQEDSVHPDYNKIGSPLRMFLDQVDLILQRIDQETPNPQLVAEKHRILRLYNRVKHSRLFYIKIGGNIYDNVTTQDVVTDALKAVRSSLTSGFTPAANFALMMTLRDIIVQSWLPIEKIANPSFFEALKQAWKNTTTDTEQLWQDEKNWFVDYNCKQVDSLSDQYLVGLLALALFVPTSTIFDMALNEEGTYKEWLTVGIPSMLDAKWDAELFIAPDSYTEDFQPDDMDEVFGYLMRTDITKDTKYFPIQPNDLYRVVLERFGEVALKLVKTSETIAHGGMIMED